MRLHLVSSKRQMDRETEKIKYKMSVQDKHGYWDSMSQWEKDLWHFSGPKTKQDKNMSVEDEIIGIDERIKQIQESGDYPKYFWGKDGVRLSRNKDNVYFSDEGIGNKYTFGVLYRNPYFSTFPPSKTKDSISSSEKDALKSLDSCQTYQPEIWKVKKDTIYAAIGAVEDGLEFAKSCLEEHDLNLGRTTKKNKCWAETIENSIRDMKIALEMLKSAPEK